MKREKLSLFILVIEIAVIAMLHSAKNSQPGKEVTVIRKASGPSVTTASYQLHTSLPAFSFK